jgi:hypothetical protein
MGLAQCPLRAAGRGFSPPDPRCCPCTRPGAATSPADPATTAADLPREVARGAPRPDPPSSSREREDPPPLEVPLVQICHQARERGRIRRHWRCSLARFVPLEVLLSQIYRRAQGRGRIRHRWRCSSIRSAAKLEGEGGSVATRGAPWPDPCRWRCSLARSTAEPEGEGGSAAGVRRR